MVFKSKKTKYNTRTLKILVMSWKSKGALTRLANTFKRLHEKKLVFKEDFEALKTLQEEINNLTELRVKEHTLFAKVVCANMYYGLLRFGDINQAIKMVQTDLDIDLTAQLENLTNELNIQQLKKLMQKNGISFELVESLEQKNKNLEIIKQHEKEFTNKILERWNFDDVKKSFEKTVNSFITNPENYNL